MINLIILSLSIPFHFIGPLRLLALLMRTQPSLHSGVQRSRLTSAPLR